MFTKITKTDKKTAQYFSEKTKVISKKRKRALKSVIADVFWNTKTHKTKRRRITFFLTKPVVGV